MANTYLTSNLIAKEAIAQFEVNNTLIATAYRGNYASMFNDNTMYAAGNTVNLRLANFYNVQRGDSVTAQDILEDSVPLTIKPLFSVPISYTPTDLQRDIVDFSSEFIEPAIKAIVAQMNIAIFNDALTQVNYFLGDSSTSLNSFATFAPLKSYMENLGMPTKGGYFTCNPIQEIDLMSSSTIQNSFLTDLNRSITIDGDMRKLLGFNFFSDQSISSFTAGTHAASGSIQVATTVSSGNTISLTGFTASQTGVINAGDVFSIGGVNSVNNVTQVATPYNMTFVAQNTVDSNSSGVATVTVYPTIDFADARANCYSSSGTIPSGAFVYFIGSHVPSFGYTTRGLVACFPPLQRMDSPDSSVITDPKWGISLRVSKTAEVLQNKNIMRIDCQMASRWIPQQAVRFVTALS